LVVHCTTRIRNNRRVRRRREIAVVLGFRLGSRIDLA
jgi:hypothetical protein